MCLLTRRHFPKNELLRLVKTPNGVVIDYNQVIKGRGCYVYLDVNFKKILLKKRGMIERSLKMVLTEEVFLELQNLR
jgi:predicted RNA-binding protein YlxR (DUF448 family)